MIGTNVDDAIRNAGSSIDIVQEATDIPTSELNASLQGQRAFTFGELVEIGGLLHVSPSLLLRGIA